MRSVIWIVLLFVVAVVAATTLGSNDGLVTLYWSGWRTDVSLNLFVILVVVVCGVLVVAAQAIQALVSLPRRAGEWRALRRERAAESALRESLIEFFGARFGRARKAAQKALAVAEETPALAGDAGFRVLAELLAAGSLHRLQDRSHRDETLGRAMKAARQGGGSRSADEAARLLGAEWALDDGDATRALDLLAALPPGAARRSHALRLRLKAARLSQQPLEALQTARLLAKHQAFSPLVAQSLLRSLAADTLEGAHDLQQLRRLWSQIDAAEDARQWLRPFWDRLAELPREDREAVALALIEARRGIGGDWLPRLESAAQGYGHEGAVVAAVGMVFAERQLWGKARRLLEQAADAPGLTSRTRRAAWRQLAALAREESDEARAVECERAAAAID